MFKQKVEGRGIKIILSLLLLILTLIATIYWFNYIGLVNIQQALFKVSKKIPGLKVVKDIQDPFLLEKEYYDKLKLSYESKFLLLKKQEEELKKKEDELKSKEQLLVKKDKALEEKENSINRKLKEYDNIKENLRKQALYFINMPPQQAVKIMNGMDELLVVDILRAMDEVFAERGEDSTVPYLLSLMPEDRAARLNELMAAGASTFQGE
jgi:flagellar protein FlbB